LLSDAWAETTTCKKGNTASSEEEFSLLQSKDYHGRSRSTNDDDEVDYVVTRDYIQTDAPGLAYRASMDLEDREPYNSLSLWGAVVRGTPSGMNWLKVGELYLPMRISGHPVLERETLSDSATLAVTGQQPEDEEENEETDADEGEEDDATESEEAGSGATESEATESETTEPDVVEEVADPEATEPEATEPEATEPGTSEEVSPEPEASESEASESDAGEEVAEPEATEPEATESDVVEEVSEPEATEPEATEPDIVEEADAAEPGISEEVSPEPEATESEASESDIVEEVAEPEPIEVESAIAADLEAIEPEAAELEIEPFDGVMVEFGVIFRAVPFLDFRSGTFTTSLALTQRWPSNASSYDAAASGGDENFWSPNLVVTNHDIGGVEVISTSITTNQTTGMVTQVDYLTIRLLQTFQLRSFPFDSQVLSVHVAPASLGPISMKLVPIDFAGEPTLDPALLEDQGFQLVSVNEEETILEAEDSQFADPARGVVEVALRRCASAYFSPLFLPAILVLFVCWSTFFLPVPVAATFATPRTAVTAVAFVASLILFLHIEQMVPARFGRMWIDVFVENIAVLVFAAVAFNTLEQYVHSHMKRPILASGISRELQIFYPSLCAFVLGLSLCVTRSRTLDVLSVVCRLTLFAGIVGYIGAAYTRALLVEDGAPRRPSITEDAKFQASVIRSDDYWRTPR